MLKLEVFDPAMCCATGICGNSVDPKLVTFASDLEWLKKHGIDVVRHGLSFEPNEFVKNEDVKTTLQKEGNDSLPIVIADNKLAYKGIYPSREQLAKTCNITWKDEFATEETTKIEAEICGPDCDCHKSAVSDNSKKVLFVVVILIMLGIIAVRLNCKNQAGAAEIKQTSKVSNAVLQPNLGKYINSLKQITPSQEVAYVYIPNQNNGRISSSAKAAVLSAKKSLEGKNINVFLYTLNSSSPEYNGIVAQTKAQSVIVIYKASGKFAIVSGDITSTKLLQGYMMAKLAGGCGSGCPCHKK